MSEPTAKERHRIAHSEEHERLNALFAVLDAKDIARHDEVDKMVLKRTSARFQATDG